MGLPIGQGKQILRQLTSIKTTIIDNYFLEQEYGTLCLQKYLRIKRNSFVFAPNEMQQAAFEGAKQNEILRILNYDTICIFCNI